MRLNTPLNPAPWKDFSFQNWFKVLKQDLKVIHTPGSLLEPEAHSRLLYSPTIFNELLELLCNQAEKSHL